MEIESSRRHVYSVANIHLNGGLDSKQSLGDFFFQANQASPIL